MYKSLQTTRAIAAILVVLFHLGGAIAAKKYFAISQFSIPFSFGGAGVEFFFVLSGFIILTAHRHELFKPEKLAGYIKKRVIRIYPTYWIIFLGVYLLAISSSTLRNSVPHDLIIILKSIVLVPQDKNIIGGTGAPVLIVAWTLQYEMFFYFSFVFMIMNRWASIFFGLTILYIFISYSNKSSSFFIFSFLSKDYVILFFMGMVVSEICSLKKITFDKPIIYLIAGLLIFSVTAFDTIMKIELIHEKKTIIYGLASSLIIFGLVKLEDSGYIIGNNKIMQLLGSSSYALYLIHFPLISILCKFLLICSLDKMGVVGAFLSYILIFISCLVGSTIFHLLIEKPIARYINRKSYQASLAK